MVEPSSPRASCQQVQCLEKVQSLHPLWCLGYCTLQRGRTLSSSGRRYKDTKPQSLSVKPSHKCISLFTKEKHSGSRHFLKALHLSIISCWQHLTFRMDQTSAERILMKHCAEHWVRVQSTRHHVFLSSFSSVLNVYCTNPG